MSVFLHPEISVLVAVSTIPLQLFLLSYFLFPLETVMLVSPVQPLNAQLPMLITLSGIVMLDSPVQSENALPPMLVTLSGIVMLVSPVQPQNA